ncbi:hypothetical protein C1H46_000134 [Malus baccata]|uniref:Uncharacterized protein n=1 Tax=Malus baccata TaxID=106549 RepID=A0A540NTC7_MALBA|nr:hypothetical protein C1H46_000134 [Malus baccata]
MVDTGIAKISFATRAKIGYLETPFTLHQFNIFIFFPFIRIRNISIHIMCTTLALFASLMSLFSFNFLSISVMLDKESPLVVAD